MVLFWFFFAVASKIRNSKISLLLSAVCFEHLAELVKKMIPILDLGLLTWTLLMVMLRREFNDDWRLDDFRCGGRFSSRWHVRYARQLIRNGRCQIGVVVWSAIYNDHDHRCGRRYFILRGFNMFLQSRRRYGSFPLFYGRSQWSVRCTRHLSKRQRKQTNNQTKNFLTRWVIISLIVWRRSIWNFCLQLSFYLC